jgi:Na+-translocating ferredoxin:NAD+ oxidoreductase RnfE subunit
MKATFFAIGTALAATVVSVSAQNTCSRFKKVVAEQLNVPIEEVQN